MAEPLDPVDLKILSALQKEGRITKLALADKVGLSPTPCWTRLKKLEKAGFIKGYRAEINLAKLGTTITVLVEVTLKQHRFEDFERFEHAIKRFPEVVECLATGGGIDYLLKIVTRDIEAYQEIVDQFLTSGLGIDRYFTYVVTRAVKSDIQPPVPLVARILARAEQ